MMIAPTLSERSPFERDGFHLHRGLDHGFGKLRDTRDRALEFTMRHDRSACRTIATGKMLNPDSHRSNATLR
jgi:hypothetical protein